MIVVDSSVWIANLRGQDRPAVRYLDTIGRPSDIVVGDIVLLEVLRGARSEAEAEAIERELRSFRVDAMLSASLASKAAAHYRLLRRSGVTVSKIPDLLIATYCVAHDAQLLHDDRHFDLIGAPLGLRIVDTEEPADRGG